MFKHLLSMVVLVQISTFLTTSSEDDKYIVIKIPDIQDGDQKSLGETDEGEKSLNQVQKGNNAPIKGDVGESERTPNETSGDDYSVLPFHLREISPEISGYIGAETQLKCQSHQPFTSCQFVSPRGDKMTVKKSTSNDGKRIQCLCNQIEYDETRVCAILIKKLRKDDEGEWLCQMEFTSIDGWKGYRGSRTRLLPKELSNTISSAEREKGLSNVICPVLSVTRAHYRVDGYYSTCQEKVPWAKDRLMYIHVDNSKYAFKKGKHWNRYSEGDKILYWNNEEIKGKFMGWSIGNRKDEFANGTSLFNSGGLNTTEPWQGEWKDFSGSHVTVKCLKSVLCPVLTVSNTNSSNGEYSVTTESMLWAPDKQVYILPGKPGRYEDNLIYWTPLKTKGETGSISKGWTLGYRESENEKSIIANPMYTSGGLHAEEPWQGEWEGNVKVKCKGMTDVGGNDVM